MGIRKYACYTRLIPVVILNQFSPFLKSNMSSNANVYPCSFTWIIHPPFVPGQTMEAKFYHETPTVTEWCVMLHFVEKEAGYWCILLSLLYDFSRDDRREIVANGLGIRVHLHSSEPIVERSIPRYSFNIENRFRYYTETDVLMFTQIEPHQMVVEIGLSLEENATNEDNLQTHLQRNPQEVSFPNDLILLARDLYKLFEMPTYYNVDLHSSDQKVYRAHSYILKARWNSFFGLHRFDTTANTVVNTDISGDVLFDILIYMYSGLLLRTLPDWANPPYMTELFQVIDRYGINHLYKVFVVSDSSQLRESSKSRLTKCYEFRLHFIHEGPVRDASINFHPVEYNVTHGVRYHQNEFKLEIQVKKWNRAGAWFSYSLRSTSDNWVYAQVNLEVLKMVVVEDNQREFIRRMPVHGCNYSIGPNESKDSGPVLFLGCLETFGNFPSFSPSNKVEQWFRFNICFTDGSSLDQLQSFNKGIQGYLPRLQVLSNHMFKLWKEEIHTDIRLVSLFGNWEDDREISYVHKGILVSRIPQLSDVMNGLQPNQRLPDFMTICVSPAALPHVVDYIYTGNLINVPEYLLEQILDFANRSGINTLGNSINALRYTRRAVW